MTKNLTMTWAVLNDPIQGPRLAATWLTDKPRTEPRPVTNRAPITLIVRDAAGNVDTHAPVVFGTYALFDPEEEPVAS